MSSLTDIQEHSNSIRSFRENIKSSRSLYKRKRLKATKTKNFFTDTQYKLENESLISSNDSFAGVSDKPPHVTLDSCASKEQDQGPINNLNSFKKVSKLATRMKKNKQRSCKRVPQSSFMTSI